MRNQPIYAAVALAILFATAGTSQAEVLIAPMSASSIPLDNPPQPIATIWADDIPTIRENRREIINTAKQLNLPFATEIFEAKLQSGDTTYILSAFNDGCWFSEALPNVKGCTAKLAKIQGDTISIITTIPDFEVVAIRGDSGFEGFNPRFNTSLQFDTETDALSYVTIEDGMPSEPVPLP